MESNLNKLRPKAYAVLYGSIIALFILGILLGQLLPETFFGAPKFLMLGLVLGALWLVILVKAIPRCPKCGTGLFSFVEFYRFPIIMRSWVGKTCSGCGAPLK